MKFRHEDDRVSGLSVVSGRNSDARGMGPGHYRIHMCLLKVFGISVSIVVPFFRLTKFIYYRVLTIKLLNWLTNKRSYQVYIGIIIVFMRSDDLQKLGPRGILSFP